MSSAQWQAATCPGESSRRSGTSSRHRVGCTNGQRVWKRHALGEIGIPTLLTGGRHDECRPEHLADMQARISGSELVIFEDSSHMAFAEERERYLAVVGDFLARVESV